MTVIKPFRAIRPTRDKAYLVATRPYYAYNETVLKAKLEHNPFTFLHVINPEFHTDDKTSPNTPERFQKIRNKFDEFIRQGIFFQEEEPSYYVYRQTIEDHVFIGIIAGASVEEYTEGHIKQHEETISDREDVFSNYLNIVEFQAEPVVLFHRKSRQIDQVLAPIMLERPEYEFTSWDRGKHEIWPVSDQQLINDIQSCYEKIEDVYIADGHHRCASAARYHAELKEVKHPNQKYFLACFMTEDRIKIFDYNRLIRDLNGLSAQEFLMRLTDHFIVTKVLHEDAAPTGLHEISMYLNAQWYKLTAKEGSFDREHPVYRLDTDILTKNILTPILGISDLRTDKRIDFIHGQKGMVGIEKKVEEGDFILGFGLFPVPVEHLKDVADENLIMPPKSTWIEPKLRSGLTIFPLDE